MSSLSQYAQKYKFNPFIEIPNSVRMMVFSYWFIYDFLLQFYYLYQTPNATIQEFCFIILQSSYYLLMLLPIIVKIQGVGLLHLLTLPTLVDLAKGRLQEPLTFITDFLENKSIYTLSSRIYDQNATIKANIEYTTLSMFCLLIFYGAFFTLRFKPKLRHFNTNISIHRLYVVTAVAFCFFVAFFVSQGGIIAYINSWGDEGGRRAAIEGEGIGVLVSFLRTLYFIPVAWYLATPGNTAFKNPVFLSAGTLFTFSGFLSSGSRSSLFAVIIIMITIWIFKNRHIPFKFLVITAFSAFFLFGLLGRLRSSVTYGGSKAADLSVFGDFQQNIDYALREGARRSAESPHIAMFAQVPEKVDYLYGQSFASLITAYIPRSIWPDKPHTGAYYCGLELFGVSWSIPIGGVAEVYWNFSWIGSILIYFLWGRLVGIVSVIFSEYYWAPGVAVIYFIVLMNGLEVSSLLLSGLLQKMVLVVIGLRYMKLI